MKVTVVVPTYNEAENLPALAKRLFALPIEGLHVLVVDDNSPDGTGQVAEQIANDHSGRISVLHRPAKTGLGRAYIEGFRKALAEGADVVVEMDADFSHPPDTLPEFLRRIEQCDVVVGSRYIPGGSVDPSWSGVRKFVSWFGSVYSRAVLGLSVHDTTAGFKAFRRNVLEALPLDRVLSNGYGFQIEMAYLCQRHGFHVCEVPIVFVDRAKGTSKMSPQIALEASWRVWQIKWRY